MLKLNNIFRVLPIALMSASSLSVQAAPVDSEIQSALPNREAQHSEIQSSQNQSELMSSLKAQIERTKMGCFYVQPGLRRIVTMPYPGQPMVVAAADPVTDPIVTFLMNGFEVKGTAPATVIAGGEALSFNAVILCKVPPLPTSGGQATK